MFHETWQKNGLTANITAGGEPNQSDCNYYAYWTDKGCRTWSLAEDACSMSNESIATLYKRTAGTKDFTVVGHGYCSQQADFQDGPAAVESDSICRQHCLKGDKGGQPGADVGLTVSAQESDDGKQIVVRIANTGKETASIHVSFSGKMGFLKDPSATVWKLGSADPLAANTPAYPTAVAPVKAGVGVTLRKPIIVPAISVAVLVVE
jgi:hypothetical protein